MTPRILVLLSTFNGEAFLDEQLRSIREQKDVNVTILVRDDGSSDGTQSILELWREKGVLTWYQGNSVGWEKSFMDLLYKSGEYDYYAFSDQDDFWMPDKLARAIFCMTSLAEGPQLYFSNLYYWREGNNEGLIKRAGLKYDKYRCLLQCLATGNTMVFNKTLRDIVVGYRHPLVCLSHDIWIYQAGILLGHVFYDRESRILYRQHGINQVGVRRSFLWNIKRKIYDLSIFMKDHRREDEAKELLNCYGNLFDEKTCQIVKVVADYRKNPVHRLSLLFSGKYVMDTLFRTVLLKARVLLGRV